MLLMTTNEIKKNLYKQDPDAFFMTASKDGLAYKATLSFPEEGHDDTYFFKIPFSDIGDAHFEHTMKAKYLIRWLPS